jgi:hypothetical protein
LLCFIERLPDIHRLILAGHPSFLQGYHPENVCQLVQTEHTKLLKDDPFKLV